MNKALLCIIVLLAAAACNKKDKDKEKEATPDAWEETTKVSTPYLQRISANDQSGSQTFMEFTVDGDKNLTAVQLLEPTSLGTVFEHLIKDKNGRVIKATARMAAATEGLPVTFEYDQDGRVTRLNHVTTSYTYVYDAQGRITERSNSTIRVTFHYSGNNIMPDSTVTTNTADPSVFTDVYTYDTGTAPISTLPQIVVCLHYEPLSFNHIGSNAIGIVRKKDGIVFATVTYNCTYNAAGMLKTKTQVGSGLTLEYDYAN